jgi:hypothetical protein
MQTKGEHGVALASQQLTLCANRSCWRFRPDASLERELEEIAEAREADVIARCMMDEYLERGRKNSANGQQMPN